MASGLLLGAKSIFRYCRDVFALLRKPLVCIMSSPPQPVRLPYLSVHSAANVWPAAAQCDVLELNP